MGSAKQKLVLTVRILALTLVLLLAQAISSGFLPAVPAADGDAAAEAAAQQSAGFLGLVLFLCLCQTVVLAYPVLRSRWHGWRLAGAMFVVHFGTVTFMGQIESLVYIRDKMPAGMQSGLFLMGFVSAAVFAPILVLVLGRWRPGEDAGEPAAPRRRMSVREWAGKLALAAAVMLALYYLFGYYVAWQNPVLRDYYGGTDPGTFFAQMRKVVTDPPWMVPFQYLRGLLWVLLALPVIRMMRGRWWEAGLAVSLLFAVPALYLLLPNPLMPEAVRMTHLVETVPYQFLFGWFVAWLFRRVGGSTAPAE